MTTAATVRFTVPLVPPSANNYVRHTRAGRHYRTAAGSKVRIFGVHSDAWECVFDWFEEPHACCDCTVGGVRDGELSWSCEECGGGSAALELVVAEVAP